MIRIPTPIKVQLAWHSARLSGRDCPSHPDDPECGWFKIKLVKNGPYVPARIWLYQEIDSETGELCDDEKFQAELNGQYADPYSQWIWMSARPITKAEYDWMMAVREYALANAQDEPAANPRQPINHLKTPIPF